MHPAQIAPWAPCQVDVETPTVAGLVEGVPDACFVPPLVGTAGDAEVVPPLSGRPTPTVGLLATGALAAGVSTIGPPGRPLVGRAGVATEEVLVAAAVVRAGVNAFTYCADVTVAAVGCVAAEVGAAISAAATDVGVEPATMTVLVTVTWARGPAVSTPTRPTEAVPMAAIDSATASHPAVSPAT